MLCGRAGGQERCAFDAIVDNEDLHLVSSFDSICSRVKTPRVKKAGGSDGKGTRVRLDEIAFPLVSTSLMEDMLGASVLKMKRRRAPAGGKSLEVGRGRGPLSD